MSQHSIVISSWFQKNIVQDNAGLMGTIGLLGSGLACYFGGFAFLPGTAVTLVMGSLCYLATCASQKLLNFIEEILSCVTSAKHTMHEVEGLVKSIDKKTIARILTKLEAIEDDVQQLIEYDAARDKHIEAKSIVAAADPALEEELEKPADLKTILKDVENITGQLSEHLDAGMLDDAAASVKRLKGAMMIFRQPEIFSSSSNSEDDAPKRTQVRRKRKGSKK